MNNSPETHRLRQILQSPHAATCKNLSHALAFESDLPAGECEAIMKSASVDIRGVVGVPDGSSEDDADPESDAEDEGYAYGYH